MNTKKLEKLMEESKDWTEVRFDSSMMFNVCDVLDKNQDAFQGRSFVQVNFIRFKDPVDATTFKLLCPT